MPTTQIHELAIYGGERSVELVATASSVFLGIGDTCLEFDKEVFLSSITHLFSMADPVLAVL